jgi:SAM-dependent methyltransferase
MTPEAVIWHDLECGAYTSDLPLWHELAGGRRGPVLDVGAGTGRIALALARDGRTVIALERDPTLASELRRRAQGLPVVVLTADACDFALAEPVELCIVPMQTIQLLDDRAAFLRCTRAALRPGALLAVALLGEGVEPFEIELEPDAVALDGVRYESAPTALRRERDTVVIERRRSRIGGAEPRSERDVVRLHTCDPGTLAAEAAPFGFTALEVRLIAPTREHAGSEIVCLEVTQ